MRLSRRDLLRAGIVGSPLGLAGCTEQQGLVDSNGTEAQASSATEASTDGETPSTTEASTNKETQSATESSTDNDTPSGSVVINEQETSGESVTIARVETGAEAIVQVSDENENFLANPGIRFEPGETREDITVELESVITDTQTITVRLFWCEESGPNTCDGPSIADDSATVTISSMESPTTEEGEETAEPSGSVEIHEQETSGESVTIARVETNVEAIIQVYDENDNFLANPGIRFEPGETREDVTVELESPITDTQTITARLFWCEESGPNTCNGPSIANDSATVTVSSTESSTTEEGEETAEPSALVVIEDQETSGESATVARVETNVEAIIQLYDENDNFLANPGIRFEPGETREDVVVQFESPITNTQTISARLFWCEESGPNTCDGPQIASDTATVTVSGG